MAVVVFARDEVTLIGGLVAQLRTQLAPGDTLHVVADHCRDGTAESAASAGARVHRRYGGRPGKGFALSWWLARLAVVGVHADGILVLDADSRPAPGLVDALRRRLVTGQAAVQARVAPEVHSNEAIPLLAAFSEEMEQSIFDRLRSWLGWSVRLRGTGMAFQRELLAGVVGSLTTTVEDAELSLLLADLGCRVRPATETFVGDPKPLSTASAQRQRARWLKGQGELLASHPLPVLRRALEGPPGWSLLSSILLKPHSLLLPLKAAAAVAGLGLLAAGAVGPLVALLLAAPGAGALLGILLGLIACSPPDRRRYLRALLVGYRYPIMWVRSARLAVVSRDPWLRVRTPSREAGIPEASRAGS